MKFSVYLFGWVIMITSCKDIIEPSIKNHKVSLEAPGNQYQSSSYAVNFWWDEVEDALKYHLQVVTPDFNQIDGLVLDTLVATNKFVINMQPGNYTWRVRAENGSSQTSYSATRSFMIKTSSLTQQTIQLIAPVNNLLTNQASVVLQWGTLYGADKYQLELDTNNFANENDLVYNQAMPGGQYTFVIPKDKTYQWRVRAQNDTSKSQWSNIYIFTYDHMPPAKVSLIAPTEGQLVNAPVSLQWNNTVTAVKYKLYVFKSDSTTVYGPGFPILLNSNSYTLATGSSGDRIYWKVSAIDAAGNEGASSVPRSFVWR